ncbi:peroxiredoxin [Halorubrum sp. Ib24]|uniref:redoxin domain-containing protein n=1 Tax=unclassified Halorubrum TaxID=2642239 RepID=UPI000B98E0E7|nr:MULTISPECIES: redoxin domain-containing protein [unclassified Halorubrum]OYR38655.1 peroxiredoxin [Halorubrum sp. Hd13]OYR39351.1 peroxiredoxin [Halorubrum sp. Ib24]OYR47648.1 peroxiredoxin [Halorubrum sp. Ea8]OYR55407.1 peroxiredoxin [Halorubrum sp. Ea1]
MPDFDVVSLPETEHVAEGDVAPDFTRPLVNEEYWEDAALDDAVDGPTLLVFHPMDGAFQATYLYNTIDDHGWADDLDVLGLSISSPYAHKRLLAERGEGVRIFSDPSAGVIEEYGLAHDIDGMTGVTETRPAVFLLDGDRAVEYAWVASEHPEFPDAEEIDDAVGRLVD